MKNKSKERKFQTKDGKFISVFWHYGLNHWVCALYDPSREDKNVVVERHSIHDQVFREEIKAKTTWYGTSKVSPLYAVRKMRYDYKYETDEKFRNAINRIKGIKPINSEWAAFNRWADKMAKEHKGVYKKFGR